MAVLTPVENSKQLNVRVQAALLRFSEGQRGLQLVQAFQPDIQSVRLESLTYRNAGTSALEPGTSRVPGSSRDLYLTRPELT
jgi:hypothetical protein